MDIGSNSSYPSNALSNFSANRFVVDGVECHSMEGFLQSLKFKSPQMQEEVCKLIGKKAKFKGKGKKWFREQVLWWKGNPMKRDSKEYQHFFLLIQHLMFMFLRKMKIMNQIIMNYITKLKTIQKPITKKSLFIYLYFTMKV